MSAMSRNKGAAFERKVAAELFTRLGIAFKRDLSQYQTSGKGDLTADDASWPFLIECKHCTRADLPAWRRQATDAARAVRLMPCVVYRITGGPIRVSVPLSAFCAAWPEGEWADVTLDGFCLIAREAMAEVGAWAPNGYTALHRQIIGDVSE